MICSLFIGIQLDAQVDNNLLKGHVQNELGEPVVDAILYNTDNDSGSKETIF